MEGREFQMGGPASKQDAEAHMLHCEDFLSLQTGQSDSRVMLSDSCDQMDLCNRLEALQGIADGLVVSPQLVEAGVNALTPLLCEETKTNASPPDGRHGMHLQHVQFQRDVAELLADDNISACG